MTLEKLVSIVKELALEHNGLEWRVKNLERLAGVDINAHDSMSCGCCDHSKTCEKCGYYAKETAGEPIDAITVKLCADCPLRANPDAKGCGCLTRILAGEDPNVSVLDASTMSGKEMGSVIRHIAEAQLREDAGESEEN